MDFHSVLHRKINKNSCLATMLNFIVDDALILLDLL